MVDAICQWLYDQPIQTQFAVVGFMFALVIYAANKVKDHLLDLLEDKE